MSEEPYFPERPAIPAALYCLVAVIAIERVTLTLGGVGPGAPLAVGLLAAVSFCLAFLGMGPARGIGFLTCVLVACEVALIVANVSATSMDAQAQQMAANPVSTMSFEATSDSSESTYGYRCQARATLADGAQAQVWLSTPDGLTRGDVLTGVGSFRAVGDDEWGKTSRSQGICGTVSLVRVSSLGRRGGLLGALLWIRQRALQVIDPSRSDSRALLAAVSVADRREMKAQELDELFATCGVAHLVAVSGSHIAVISSICSTFLLRMRLKVRPRLALLTLATLAFVLMCGAAPSALRAWAMSVVASASVLVGRRSDALSSSCLVALAMALIDPTVSGQLGFLLSVTCVVGLCLFSPWVTYVLDLMALSLRLPASVPSKLRIRLRRYRSEQVESLAASLVAMCATLPLVAAVFSEVSLVSPLATLLASLPLFAGLGCGLLAVLCSFLPLLPNVFLGLADLLLALVLAVLRLLSRIPFACVPVDVGSWWLAGLVVGLALLLLLFWPKPSKGMVRAVTLTFVLVLLAIVLRWRFFAPARVCVLDVGQGDAILVQEGGTAILVDAGPSAAALERALAREHVLHLDAVVITHLHEDHYGGLDGLVGRVAVERVLVAEGAKGELSQELAESVSELTGAACEELRYGDGLHVGGFELECVWPREEVDGHDNEDSLIMTLQYEANGRELEGLLTGDAEKDQLEEVIRARDASDIDFLKVGHHGSEVSISDEEAAFLLPELAVASAGEGNSYGHPRAECVKTLTEAGARFLCTKDVGDVEIRPASEGVAVKTQR